MTDGAPLTIAEAGEALRSGTITSVGLTTAALALVDALNADLGAFVTVLADAALASAEAADAAFAAGRDAGPLQGIPLAVKDIIATKDAPTTANSRVLDPAWGTGVDAPVVARLRDAGAVVVGKTTTSEFACGAPDPDKGFLVPRNPWNTECTPAGSSSGTGVAVAAGLALGGLGTDTGGSVRGPASVNGHTGLKVTFGRVPKNGVVPLGYSLDSIGPMARSAYDCALMLQVMAGYDPGDACAARVDVADYAGALTGDVTGLRIGVAKPYFFDVAELDPEVASSVLAAVDVLSGLGAKVSDVTVPFAKEAKEANTLTMVAEAYAYHRQDLVEKWGDYGRYTRPMLARGAFYTAADFAQAQRFRSFFRREVARVLADVDVIVTPSMLTPAERIVDMDMDRRILGPSFTGQWNLAGLPAVAVPCGFSSGGLPLSMQVVGRPFDEAMVLRVADAYQRSSDWHLRVPPVASVVAA
jgi:aspartyl-tRNA(Asn)/glutamyl-tRNA(Gln) amidotransferase subunit A